MDSDTYTADSEDVHLTWKEKEAFFLISICLDTVISNSNNYNNDIINITNVKIRTVI